MNKQDKFIRPQDVMIHPAIATKIDKKILNLLDYPDKVPSDPLIPESEVRKIEQHFGVSLPPDYLYFAIKYGGMGMYGVFEMTIPCISAEDFALESIESLQPDAHTTVWERIQYYVSERDILPLWLMPIGSDPGDNVIALSMREEDWGSVWFSSMDRGVDEPDACYAAPSFLEFVRSLKSHEEDDYSSSEKKEDSVDDTLNFIREIVGNGENKKIQLDLEESSVDLDELSEALRASSIEGLEKFVVIKKGEKITLYSKSD